MSRVRSGLAGLQGVLVEQHIVVGSTLRVASVHADQAAPFFDTLSVYARAENLTDARYQDVYDYGTAGRSFYAGLRATW